MYCNDTSSTIHDNLKLKIPQMFINRFRKYIFKKQIRRIDKKVVECSEMEYYVARRINNPKLYATLRMNLTNIITVQKSVLEDREKCLPLEQRADLLAVHCNDPGSFSSRFLPCNTNH